MLSFHGILKYKLLVLNMRLDKMDPRMVKELADIIVRLLLITFALLEKSGELPNDLKKANVTPIFKDKK